MNNNYIPTKWVGGKTVATADVMNNIEKGISDMHIRTKAISDTSESIIQSQSTLSEQFKNLIINAGNSNAEVVLSRGDNNYLPDRLNKFDEQFNTNEKKIKNITYLISDFPRLNVENEDSPRIQRAIDFVSENGGGTIKFSHNIEYILKSQIKLKPYVLLKGGDFITNRDYTKNVTLKCYYGKNDIYSHQILMDLSSAISGFTFYYPEQVDSTSSSPVEYGFTISADTTKEYNIDNIYIENIMLLNSYNGINLDKAGRFNITNLYGQPFKTGLFIDRVKDVARIKHVHFWSFYAGTSSTLYKWIKENGRAFDINRIDQISAFDMFCYGYNDGFYFGNVGNGGCWGTFTSCCADVCNRPIHVDKINFVEFLGGTFTTANLYKPNFTTSGSIGGTVKFIGQEWYGGNAISCVLSSADGTVIFNGNSFRDTDNSIKAFDIINESTCNVIINGCKTELKRITGGETTIIDGFKLLSSDVDVTPIGVMDISNWKKISSVGGLSKIDNGISFQTTTSNCVYDYNLPVGDFRQNFVNIEFEYQDSEYVDHRCVVRVCRDDGGHELVRLIGSTNYGTKDKVKFKFPLWIGEFTGNLVLRFEFSTYDVSKNLNVNITNLKFYKTSPNNITNSQLQYIHKNRPTTATARLSTPISVNENNRTILYNGKTPDNGNWLKGDILVNNNPTEGGYEKLICTESGNPGIWKGVGLIQS